MLGALLQAMRPHQWVKNLLTLAPVVFAHELGDPSLVLRAAAAFAVFCMLSSSVYLLNDLVDRAADAAHPKKRNRPIASGALPVGVAAAALLVLAVGGLGTALALGASGSADRFVIWPALYFAMNIAYSFCLKRIVIVDCLTIALGFAIRVHAGAVVIGVATSSWILLCTFFFALFLAFCKRREEVERMGASGGATRATIREYDLPFLDQMIAPLAALTILCYALYTVDPHSVALHGPRLKFTIPLVVFGVFRYVFLVHKRGEGADPARLLFRDRQLVASGLLYAAMVWWVVGERGVG